MTTTKTCEYAGGTCPDAATHWYQDASGKRVEVCFHHGATRPANRRAPRNCPFLLSIGAECKCHDWTGDAPHHAPGVWLADCGMGGTYVCCEETKQACERQAAEDPSIDPATFTRAGA